jgi:hypothetical protein
MWFDQTYAANGPIDHNVKLDAGDARWNQFKVCVNGSSPSVPLRRDKLNSKKFNNWQKSFCKGL